MRISRLLLFIFFITLNQAFAQSPNLNVEDYIKSLDMAQNLSQKQMSGLVNEIELQTLSFRSFSYDQTDLNYFQKVSERAID